MAARNKAELIGFASAEPSTSLAGRNERDKHDFVIAKGFVDTRLFLLEPGGGNYSSLRTTKSRWRSMVVSPTGELIETARCADLILVGSAVETCAPIKNPTVAARGQLGRTIPWLRTSTAWTEVMVHQATQPNSRRLPTQPTMADYGDAAEANPAGTRVTPRG